jgi:hypothetical protein
MTLPPMWPHNLRTPPLPALAFFSGGLGPGVGTGKHDPTPHVDSTLYPQHRMLVEMCGCLFSKGPKERLQWCFYLHHVEHSEGAES